MILFLVNLYLTLCFYVYTLIYNYFPTTDDTVSDGLIDLLPVRIHNVLYQPAIFSSCKSPSPTSRATDITDDGMSAFLQ